MSFRIIIQWRYQTWVHWIIMFVLSWLAYTVLLIVMQYGGGDAVGTMSLTFYSGKFYFSFILIVGTCCMIDYFTHCYEFLFYKTTTTILVKKVKELGSLNNNIDLGDKITKLLEKVDQAAPGANNLEKKISAVDAAYPGEEMKPLSDRKAYEKDLEKIDGVNLREIKLNEERYNMNANGGVKLNLATNPNEK